MVLRLICKEFTRQAHVKDMMGTKSTNLKYHLSSFQPRLPCSPTDVTYFFLSLKIASKLGSKHPKVTDRILVYRPRGTMTRPQYLLIT